MLTGLTLKLTPYTRYTLDLFSAPIAFSAGPDEQTLSFSYGSQSGTAPNVDGQNLVSFSFTTGAVPNNTLKFNAVDGSTSGSTSFPGISGFAIVGQGVIPEPSSYAMLLAGLGVLAVFGASRRSKV